MMMTRATIAGVAATVVLAALAAPAAGNERETLQRASEKAVAQIEQSLRAARLAPKTGSVAVLPVEGDKEEYVTNLLKTAVTRTDLSLFTRNDETWKKLVAEIERGVRQKDIMDAATIQKFGRIQGVSAILYGRIWDESVNMWSIRGRVKVSVHLAAVETGQIVWSSGPVEGDAYMHWSEAVSQFWRYPLVIVAALVAFLIAMAILRGIVRIIKHAMRPL
jgi:TolB-like protein